VSRPRLRLCAQLRAALCSRLPRSADPSAPRVALEVMRAVTRSPGQLINLQTFLKLGAAKEPIGPAATIFLEAASVLGYVRRPRPRGCVSYVGVAPKQLAN
jgi:hypothetical protein